MPLVLVRYCHFCMFGIILCPAGMPMTVGIPVGIHQVNQPTVKETIMLIHRPVIRHSTLVVNRTVIPVVTKTRRSA